MVTPLGDCIFSASTRGEAAGGDHFSCESNSTLHSSCRTAFVEGGGLIGINESRGVGEGFLSLFTLYGITFSA